MIACRDILLNIARFGRGIHDGNLPVFSQGLKNARSEKEKRGFFVHSRARPRFQAGPCTTLSQTGLARHGRQLEGSDNLARAGKEGCLLSRCLTLLSLHHNNFTSYGWSREPRREASIRQIAPTSPRLCMLAKLSDSAHTVHPDPTRRGGGQASRASCCLSARATKARDNDDYYITWDRRCLLELEFLCLFPSNARPVIINDDRCAGPPASYSTEYEQFEGVAVGKQAHSKYV